MITTKKIGDMIHIFLEKFKPENNAKIESQLEMIEAQIKQIIEIKINNE